MKTLSERVRGFCETMQPENVFSQWGEDGLLRDIFNRIGTTNRWVMECGAADGVFFSNSAKLIQDGWNALLIEADEAQFGKLAGRYLDNKNVTCFNYKVEPTGVYSFDTLLAKTSAPPDIDLAVIDVDGQDYWLFNSLLAYRPRVILCEFDPNADPHFIPEMGGEGQAGVEAIKHLGIGKLYYPIGQTWCNLIFVRQDLLGLLTEDGQGITEREVKDVLPVKLAAAMSTPRLGFLTTTDCVYSALGIFGVPLSRGEGAYWHHSLSRSIQTGIDKGASFILTMDYDTAFTPQDVANLVVLLQDHEDVDVVVAMQQKREGGELLASGRGDTNLVALLNAIKQGHFGLTLFRSEVFSNISKPWFWEKPNEDGDWGEGRIDADIGFWLNCEEKQVNVQMAMDVVVGHIELVISWPSVTPDNLTFRSFYQPMGDWRKDGKPEAAFDRKRVMEWANQGLISCPTASLEMK